MSIVQNKLRLIFSRERDEQERRLFHQIFNDWLATATDEDFQQLEEARSWFAAGQVCSAFTLVRRCLEHDGMQAQLPLSLRQRLQERNWPQACAGATVP